MTSQTACGRPPRCRGFYDSRHGWASVSRRPCQFRQLDLGGQTIVATGDRAL